jgi:hypothetical protein
MVSKAQAECVAAVEVAKEREREARKEAKDAQIKMSQDLKKVQRQLAGVTGQKDDEIERLETRVSTCEYVYMCVCMCGCVYVKSVGVIGQKDDD